MQRIHKALLVLASLGIMTMPWFNLAFAADDHPGRALAANCTGCHGTQGRSVGGMPTLAGLERSYIVSTMKEFKAGTRQATIMHQHAKGYADADIEVIADYFSAQRAR